MAIQRGITATAFGEAAYPTLVAKAAALFHSLAKNHPLVDGDKRLALAGGATFLWINGTRLTMTNDEAYEFIISIASGDLDNVDDIAKVLRRKTKPRPA